MCGGGRSRAIALCVGGYKILRDQRLSHGDAMRLAGLGESLTCREALNATLRREKIFTEGSWWPRKNKGPIGEVW